MELTIDQALQKGVEAHKAGNVQEADSYYTAILQAQPSHSDANHNMGVLAVGLGKVQEALPFFKTALKTNASVAQYWLSYIDALIKLDKITDAKAVFDQAKNKGAKGNGFDQLEIRLAQFTQIDDNQSNEKILDKAIELRERGKYDEAIDFLTSKKDSFATTPNLPAILSHCYMLNDNLKQAKVYLDAAKKINPDIPSVGWNETRLLLKQNKVNEALALAYKTNKLFPDDIEGMAVLGSCLRASSRFDESLKYLNKAIELSPDYAEALINRGLVSLAKKDKARALEDLEKAHHLKPHIKQIWYLVLNLKMEIKEFESVIILAEEMIKISPLDDKILASVALCHQHLQNYEKAVAFYNKALTINPNYGDSWANLGSALKMQGRSGKAIAAYSKALVINPDNAAVHNNMGVALQDLNKLDEAIEAFDKALQLKPDYPEAYNNIGISLRDQGKAEKAIEAFCKALHIKPDYADAHRNLSSIKKYKTDDKHFLQVCEIYKQENLTEDAKCKLSFTLAKMYDDLGDLHKAYTHLFEGNSLRKKLLNYSINDDSHIFTKLKETQPRLQKNSLEIEEVSTKNTPIFIIGMPRSGTTLIEQIISSHSNVIGAGELNHVSQFGGELALNSKPINTETLSEFRDKYLLELSKVPNAKLLVTDKMPQNFRFIPLICAAFPEAKIIHVQRDAAATCWSNYKHYFTTKALGYSYDINDLVTYYKLYKDLMEFWQSKYSDRVYDLNYENLTIDQEKETRNLIDHLELNWEEACLSPHQNNRSVRTASHQQVRQKVYRGSSEAWRKYEPYLNNAFNDLKST